MADTSLSKLAGHIHLKAMELATRAHALAAEAKSEGEIEFVIEMIEESERAVTFWCDKIKKAARK